MEHQPFPHQWLSFLIALVVLGSLVAIVEDVAGRRSAMILTGALLAAAAMFGLARLEPGLLTIRRIISAG